MENGPLYMLHVMSEVRGWSHDEMLKMNKRVFYRYYGYWYKDRINEKEYYEKMKAEHEAKQRESERELDWKAL